MSQNQHTDHHPKILVTGASGFIGGWIAETFHSAGLPVRAGVRRWQNAVRLARRNIEFVSCDVLDPRAIDQALSGCTALVHCAVGDSQVSEQGTRNVLAAAEKAGLLRVVHLSSAAVYGTADGTIDESHPLAVRGNRYTHQKINAEQICRQFIQRDVPVSILRPTIVYGPFSYTWTISFAHRLSSGNWGTFGPAGDGKCNLVYVTDLVQAVYRALFSDAAVGQCYNVNGGEVITWNEYFTRFNQALDLPPLQERAAWVWAVKSRILAPIRSLGRFALSRFNTTLMQLNTRVAWAGKTMKATESTLKLTPTADQLRLYGLHAEYSIDKLRRQLGYHPQVSIDRGLQFSAAWLRAHDLMN